MPLIEFKRAGGGEREGEGQEDVGLLDLAIGRVCIYIWIPEYNSFVNFWEAGHTANSKREKTRTHRNTVILQPQTFRIQETMPEPTVPTYPPSDDWSDDSLAESTDALSKDVSVKPSIARLSVTYESGASREVPTISPPDKPDDTSTIGFNGRAASTLRSILPEGEQYSLLREADPLSVIDSFVFSDERKRVECEPVESIETTAPVENRVPIEDIWTEDGWIADKSDSGLSSKRLPPSSQRRIPARLLLSIVFDIKQFSQEIWQRRKLVGSSLHMLQHFTIGDVKKARQQIIDAAKGDPLEKPTIGELRELYQDIHDALSTFPNHEKPNEHTDLGLTEKEFVALKLPRT